MKRRTLFIGLVLIATLLLVSGCDLLFGSSVEGEWYVDYTWDEDDTYTMIVTFDSDGSFETDEGGWGVWDQDDDEVKFTYTGPGDADAIYDGVIEFGGDTMSGTMYDPSADWPGSWVADRISSRSLSRNLVTENERSAGSY